MNNSKMRKQYSANLIRKHWAEKNIWRRKGYQSKEEFIADKYACFACMFSFSRKHPGFPLEKCHIKAVAIGGDDVIENIHLLCPPCHQESEKLDGPAYWRWFVKSNFIDRLLGHTVSKYPDTIMLFHDYLSEGHSLQDIRILFADAYQRYLAIRDDWLLIEKDPDPCVNT